MCAFVLHLAFPLTGWWWLTPFALAGLIASWCSVTPRSAVLIGYTSGLLFFAFGFTWFGQTAGALLGPAAPILDIGPAAIEACGWAFAATLASFAAQRCNVRVVPFVAAAALAGAFYSARWFWAVIALAVGVASAVAKPSFDALVQRHVRESNQGRAFARNETRFQIMWVVGSFVPVVLSLPVPAGNLVMAVAAAVGAVSYMSSLRAVDSNPEARARPTG